MALSLTELNAATSEYWKDKEVSDILFKECVIFWKLMSKSNVPLPEQIVRASELVDGGTKIRVFIEHDKAVAGRYGAGVTMATTKKDIINAARYDIGGYYAMNKIDLNDQVQNAGDEQLVDLVNAKMRNIEKSLRDYMATGIYGAATGTPMSDLGFIGLESLFLATSSTAYGDIAEDDMAAWAPNNITTAEAISYKVCQAIWRAAATSQTRAGKPNLAVTTDVLVDGYERTLQTQQRFQDQKMVEAGFDNVLHKGTPIVADEHQAAGTLDALNLNYLGIKTHKDYNFTKPEWRELSRTKPDEFMADSRWIGQLICKNRAAHCRHTNLTEPA